MKLSSLICNSISVFYKCQPNATKCQLSTVSKSQLPFSSEQGSSARLSVKKKYAICPFALFISKSKFVSTTLKLAAVTEQMGQGGKARCLWQ
jgi:hypothetical protein